MFHYLVRHDEVAGFDEVYEATVHGELAVCRPAAKGLTDEGDFAAVGAYKYDIHRGCQKEYFCSQRNMKWAVDFL